MRRAARMAGLMLVAGTLLNVGVAWTLALWTARAASVSWEARSGFVIRGEALGAVGVLERPGSRIISIVWRDPPPPVSHWAENIESRLPRWSRGARAADGPAPADGMTWIDYAHGWPLLALSCGIDIADSRQAPTFVTRIHHGWTLESNIVPQLPRMRILPLRPLWRGFALNSIVYAAALGVLVFAPGAIRRTLRRRRGQCVICGYDLRGSGHVACPECGRPVARPS